MAVVAGSSLSILIGLGIQAWWKPPRRVHAKDDRCGESPSGNRLLRMRPLRCFMNGWLIMTLALPMPHPCWPETP